LSFGCSSSSTTVSGIWLFSSVGEVDNDTETDPDEDDDGAVVTDEIFHVVKRTTATDTRSTFSTCRNPKSRRGALLLFPTIAVATADTVAKAYDD
jgi:hypothetical protein